MKPLILILLAAVVADAQSLVDVARRERARQTQIAGARVYTNIDAGNPVAPPALPTDEVIRVAPVAAAAPGQAAAAPGVGAVQPTAVPVADPAQQWTVQVQKVRARIGELQDLETTLQLQINELNNQFTAPVTTQAARTQAQKKITDAQTRLATAQRELADSRIDLQQLETQGPPVK